MDLLLNNKISVWDKNVRLCFILSILILIPTSSFLPLKLISIIVSGVYFFKGGKITLNKKIFGFCSLLFIFTYIFSYMVHMDGVVYTINSIIYFVGEFVFMPNLIYRKLNTRTRIYSYIKLLVVFFFIYSICGLVETFSNVNLVELILGTKEAAGVVNGYRYGLVRSNGLCSISINNAMLMYLAWGLSFFYSIAFKKDSKIFRLISYIVIGLYTIIIISKAVIIISLLTQVVLYWKFKGSKNTKKSLITMAIMAVSLVLLFNSDFILTRYLKNIYIPIFNSVFGTNYIYDESIGLGGFGERFELFGWVWEDIKGHRLFGVGFLQQFNHVFHKISAYGNSSMWYKNSIENSNLYYLYRMGIFGLIGFIMYQIGCLRFAINNRKKSFSLSFVVLVLTVGYFILINACYGQEDFVFFVLLFSAFITEIEDSKREV